MSHLIVGCYTEDEGWVVGKGRGLSVLTFDAELGTATPRAVTTAPGLINPSFALAMPGPTGTRLFAASELSRARGPEGQLFEFELTAGGALSLVRQMPIGGSSTCHLAASVDGRWLAACHYESGGISLFDLAGPAPWLVAVRTHEGQGLDIERQSSPHPHMARFTSDDALYVADLGIDRVLAYRLDDGFVRTPERDLVLPPGAGPRHFVFHPRLPLAYVVGELDARLYVFSLGDSPRRVSTLSLTPSDFSGDNALSEIAITSDGHFIYAGCRGPETVACLALDQDGQPALVEQTPTLGACPRHFTLDEQENWLIIANQNSDSLVGYRRDPSTGRLSDARILHEPSTPSCVIFA